MSATQGTTATAIMMATATATLVSEQMLLVAAAALSPEWLEPPCVCGSAHLGESAICGARSYIGRGIEVGRRAGGGLRHGAQHAVLCLEPNTPDNCLPSLSHSFCSVCVLRAPVQVQWLITLLTEWLQDEHGLVPTGATLQLAGSPLMPLPPSASLRTLGAAAEHTACPATVAAPVSRAAALELSMGCKHMACTHTPLQAYLRACSVARLPVDIQIEKALEHAASNSLVGAPAALTAANHIDQPPINPASSASPIGSSRTLRLSGLRSRGRELEPLVVAMSASVCELHHLAICNSEIEPVHLRALTAFLVTSSPLLSLDLSSQALTSEALTHLLEAATNRALPSLISLVLRHNPIGEGCDASHAEFGQLPTGGGGWQLRQLDLADTMMGDRAALNSRPLLPQRPYSSGSMCAGTSSRWARRLPVG